MRIENEPRLSGSGAERRRVIPPPLRSGFVTTSYNRSKAQRYRGANQSGFTLIEVLAASLLLALGVATICGICSRALSQASVDQSIESAWRVIDRQFTLIDTMGIDAFVLKNETEGTQDYLGKEFYWSAVVQQGDLDRLYTVTLIVSWQDGKRGRQVSCSTMFNGQLPAGLS